MIINDSIKIKNYKCFGDTEQGIDNIYPINIIIGKNNAGKSSLLDIISSISYGEIDMVRGAHRDGKMSEVTISHTFSEKEVNTLFKGNPLHPKLLSTVFNSTVNIQKRGSDMGIISWSKEPAQEVISRQAILMHSHFLAKKRFKSITAERDVSPEGINLAIQRNTNGTNVIVTPDGKGLTSLLQSLLINNDYTYYLSLVKIELLHELNLILNPEIHFEDIIIQEDSSKWEISFRDKNGFIKLSKMGSGIKTILLVILNLLVIPKVEKRSKSQYVFAFEELENNLHPSLLRRLFAYIKKYSEENNSYFFITTHSSTVIDLFSGYENAQIIHVTSDGRNSTCAQVSTFFDNKRILQDLDVKASDLLQSNGIIWVEGPSDRIYLTKWLSIVSPELIEGIHYSILFYGGRLLANLSFDAEWLAKELIPLLKVNHNAFVIIDRDGESEEKKINSTKERIQKEIGDNNCWITKGREIENYLSDKSLSKWLSKYLSKEIKNNINDKLESSIRFVDKKDIIKYDANKKNYSIEISEHISNSDIEILDLKEKLEILVGEIKKWNSL